MSANFITSFESSMNALAFTARKGIHGFTTADVLKALQDTKTSVRIDLPDHVVCGDAVIDMPSDEKLRGRDFTVSVMLGEERFGMRVHDEMHVYCTDPKVLEPFMVYDDGCPYVTSSLDMRQVEALRKDGIRVSKTAWEGVVPAKKRKTTENANVDKPSLQPKLYPRVTTSPSKTFPLVADWTENDGERIVRVDSLAFPDFWLAGRYAVSSNTFTVTGGRFSAEWNSECVTVQHKKFAVDVVGEEVHVSCLGVTVTIPL
jgi:hypothetical protein